MAKAVVDALEMIDVAHHHRGAASFAPRTQDIACHQFDNHPTIPQRGQQVVRGLEAHAFARFHQAVLKFQDALPGAQPRFRLIDVKTAWLGNRRRRTPGPGRCLLSTRGKRAW
jgi:hypothetical protein